MEHKAQKGAAAGNHPVRRVVVHVLTTLLLVGIALSIMSAPKVRGLRLLEAVFSLSGSLAHIAAHVIPVLWIAACLMITRAGKSELRRPLLSGFMFGFGMSATMTFFLEPGGRLLDIFRHDHGALQFNPFDSAIVFLGCVMLVLGGSLSALVRLPIFRRNGVKVGFAEREASKLRLNSVALIALGMFVMATTLFDSIKWQSFPSYFGFLIFTIIASGIVSVVALIMSWRRIDEMERQIIYRANNRTLFFAAAFFGLTAVIEAIQGSVAWSYIFGFNVLVIAWVAFIEAGLLGSDSLSPDCQDNQQQALRAGFY